LPANCQAQPDALAHLAQSVFRAPPVPELHPGAHGDVRELIRTLAEDPGLTALKPSPLWFRSDRVRRTPTAMPSASWSQMTADSFNVPSTPR
jgi:hypothetical protein